MEVKSCLTLMKLTVSAAKKKKKSVVMGKGIKNDKV